MAKGKSDTYQNTLIRSPEKAAILGALCLLLAVTAVSFYPSLNNGFPNWDDGAYLIENTAIRDISWQAVKKIFSSFYVACYLPLTILSYALEYHFFGLDPSVYHTTNLILHLLNCLLVFWVIFKLGSSVTVSLVTAVLFGIHPLHVESVAWVSERKDVLSTVFFLAAVISYLSYQKSRAMTYYSASLACLALSLLAKAMAITLPFVLLLCDYYNNRKFDRNVLTEKIPFFMIAALFGAIAIFAQHSYGGVRQGQSSNVLYNMVIAGYGLIFYVIKTALPVKLSCLYPYPAGALLPYRFYIGAALAAVFMAAVIVYGRHSRKVIFGSLFFLITLLPVLQLVPIGQAMAADRYTYIPSIGLFYLTGEAFVWLYRKKGSYERVVKTVLPIAGISMVILLSFLTWNRCQVWKDGITLWSDVLKNYPDEPVAYSNRGLALYKKGTYHQALTDFSQALKISPRFVDARNNRGIVYKQLKDYKRALADYTESLQINPRYVKAYSNRGLVYHHMREYEKALVDFNQALAIDPQFAIAYYNRGNTYTSIGEDDKAIADYREALKIDPNYAEACNNRANIFLKKGTYDKAIDDYNRALKINPQFATARFNRAVAWYKKREYGRAWEDVKALEASGASVNPEFLRLLTSASPAGAQQ